MKWIEATKALKRCLTDSDGINFPGWGCSDCPFAKTSHGAESPNSMDPDEGHYDCSLTGAVRVWGEEPACEDRDWANEIQREVEKIEERYSLLEGNCWIVWSNDHEAWWGPKRSGYFTDIASAGRYTYAEAVKICASRSESMTYPSLPPELIQPSPELRAFLAKI